MGHSLVENTIKNDRQCVSVVAMTVNKESSVAAPIVQEICRDLDAIVSSPPLHLSFSVLTPFVGP